MARRLIRNYRRLATTGLRRDALAVLEAGLRAIDTKAAVERVCRRTGSKLSVDGRVWNLNDYDHVYVIAIGKAAADAGLALEKLLGDRIADGIALDVKKVRLKRIKSVAGSHPLPSVENMRATGEIMAILKHVDSRDLGIAVVSGGGSALLCWPFELKRQELVRITETMMKKGASIQEINTVRKHLSEIQGGQFARLAHPATVIGLVFSDVPGDGLEVVASGPTVMDPTTVADAREIIEKYDLMRACRLPSCELRETPKDPVYFERVTNVLVISNGAALSAMEAEARRRGYAVRVHSRALRGEARAVGAELAGLPVPGEMVLAAGETTVVVKGSGRGGRNQEVALGALDGIPDDGLALSCASDGIDNTPAAGAVADAVTRRAAARKRLDPAKALAENDSYAFFKAAGQHIITGVTGANVSDLMLAARSKKPEKP